MYLWFKLLHIFFVISWFAGLFYLPRIFVNLAECPTNSPEYVRLLEMSQRLCRFMTPLGFLALLFGLSLPGIAHWWSAGWVHAKIAAGLFLAAYNIDCMRHLHRFANRTNTHSHRWFRIYNELPVLVLGAALFFVLFKPF